jgi:rhodanese-related sulfurtransferase
MSEQVAELDPQDVASLLKAGEVVLVDVREPAEYAFERIHGALLYPMSTFDPKQLPPDESRRIVFHCASGRRSLDAGKQRLATGQHAAHMKGGINAWKAAGLPVVHVDPATGQILDTPR